MQRREGSEIPAGAPPQPHVRQGELRADKRVQDVRARRPLRGVGGRALLEARGGFLRLLQAAPSRHVHQGQKPRQTGDRLRLPDIQQTQARAETVFCICFLPTLQSVRPMGKPRNRFYLIPLHYLL
jgi:hypothetical protein